MDMGSSLHICIPCSANIRFAERRNIYILFLMDEPRLFIRILFKNDQSTTVHQKFTGIWCYKVQFRVILVFFSQ